MKEGIIVGMALGFLVGAVLIQGNKQAQDIVKQGKQVIAKKAKEIGKQAKSELGIDWWHRRSEVNRFGVFHIGGFFIICLTFGYY